MHLAGTWPVECLPTDQFNGHEYLCIRLIDLHYNSQPDKGLSVSFPLFTVQLVNVVHLLASSQGFQPWNVTESLTLWFISYIIQSPSVINFVIVAALMQHVLCYTCICCYKKSIQISGATAHISVVTGHHTNVLSSICSM